jgi:hypothetical protein
MTNLERFVTVLTDQYSQLFEHEPTNYGMAKARYTPAELAEKMTMSLKNGTANKDGEGIKRTCKALGITYTYKALNAYLA